MRLELILLAAGQSKRFGGIKQLADIDGQPMICHCLSQYRQGNQWLSGVAQGTVVLGANAELIAQILPHKVNIFVASTWQKGMGHSLAESMQIIASDTTHILVGLADQIAITPPMIMKMLDESKTHPKKIIASQYSAGLGAPVIFPKQYFSQLSHLIGDKGAKAILHSHLHQVISIESLAAACDIDTQEDLKRVQLPHVE